MDCFARYQFQWWHHSLSAYCLGCTVNTVHTCMHTHSMRRNVAVQRRNVWQRRQGGRRNWNAGRERWVWKVKEKEVVWYLPIFFLSLPYEYVTHIHAHGNCYVCMSYNVVLCMSHMHSLSVPLYPHNTRYKRLLSESKLHRSVPEPLMNRSKHMIPLCPWCKYANNKSWVEARPDY